MSGTSDDAVATTAIATVQQKVWTQQPQAAVGIDPKYRDKASIAWMPGTPDLVTGKTPVLDAQASYKIGGKGRALVCDGTGYTRIGATFTTTVQTPNRHTDFIVISDWAVGTSYSGLITNSDYNGASIETNGTLSWHNGGGTLLSSLVIDARPHVVACRHSYGVGATFFLDGVASTFISLAGEYGWAARTWPAYIGSDTAKQKIYLVYSVNKLLSDAEIASLSANPWQIFAPQSTKIWVPA